ncbi:MAG TPA: hypothetical protein VIM29_02090 [Bacillota bacterium]
MVHFGFISAMIEPEAEWLKRLNWFPLRLKYFNGPLKAGEVTGVLPREKVRGWAWNVPENQELVWSSRQRNRLWQRLWDEVYQKQIKVVGLDPGIPLLPPAKLKNQPYFPGISDGKALELLLFIDRFRSLLRSYEIPAQRVKVLIVWEEGNLGLTCARLIAPEVRFMTLVCPNAKLLEQAAETVLAESGVAPQTTQNWPADYKGARIIIKCGKIKTFPLRRDSRRLIWCELFQQYPQLALINLKLPVSARQKSRHIPVYPVLGEVILRAGYHYDSEFWYGSQLPLERVIKLGRIFNDLGAGIVI